MNKPNVAIVRGAFLNPFEMQQFAPLTDRYRITAFSSLYPIHANYPFPTERLLSPMDIPSFPYKMPLLNRLFVDAHYLLGLEKKLRGFAIAHTAETYYHYTQQCLAAKRNGWVGKVVVTVWETLPHNNEGIWGRKQFKARTRQEADHFVAVTRKAKGALLAEGVPPSKITVIGPHVDTDRFHPIRHTKQSRSEALSRPFTILFCGRLEVEKGVLDFADALTALSADTVCYGKPLHVRIVGRGGLERTLREKLQLLPPNWHSTIESAKYSDMPGIYRNADLFVAPSKPTGTWEEQFGMSLLEAQASGLPIITTRTGGIPENVGDAAVLISPGDTVQLVRAIRDTYLHPAGRRAIGARARKRAVTTYRLALGADRIDAIYRNLLRIS